MTPSADHCGYTWPEEFDPENENPDHQSCCYRETWGDHGACIWHAEPGEGVAKPVEELRAQREPVEGRHAAVDGTPDELLDGAKLAGCELGDALAFDGSALRGANLRDADFAGADLAGALLVDANLFKTDLSGADLEGADLTDAYVAHADLSGAGLEAATLIDASMAGVSLAGAFLRDADLSGAYLRGADLSDAWLDPADLTGVVLEEAALREADLADATFADADLCRADLTDAELRNADLSGAALELAVLTRADLFGVTFAGARLEGAVFADVRLDEATFANAKAPSSDDTSRPLRRRIADVVLGPAGPDDYRCPYDPRSAFELPTSEAGTTPEKRAAAVYRQFEQLARVNAYPEWGRRYFLLRQDAQTRQYRRDGAWTRYAFATLQRTLLGYGESFRRVVVWSGTTILLFAGIYLASGAIRPVTPGGEFGPPVSASRLPADLGVLWDGLYYSTLTFTSLGFGDYRPVTTFGQVVTVAETALGAILMALLVFVLGRRAAR